jgi:hypothetical protein
LQNENKNHIPLSRLPEHKNKENGRKISEKQNHLYKTCGHQFIGDHALQYKGYDSGLTQKILMMLVRGTGIKDIVEIEKKGSQRNDTISMNIRWIFRASGCRG